MKKCIQITIALLGILMLSAAFTSCDKLNNGGSGSSSKFYYKASGSIQVQGSISDILSAPSVADYQTAINNAVGSGAVAQNDAAVISACESVYAKHKQFTGKLSGSVTIERATDGGQSTTLKTYTY